MKEFLKVGLIQPVIDPYTCWNALRKSEISSSEDMRFNLNIEPIFAERVWQEIQDGLSALLKTDNKPDIILIPELHVPPRRVSDLKRISKSYNTIIIAGVDFQRNPLNNKKIRNRGVLIIPNGFGTSDPSTRVTTLNFGKTYFTYMERNMFPRLNGEEDCTEDQEQNMYIFQLRDFGNFGIMICSDIFDIERMMLYQARIHHLFVISLNKDLNTYFSMAESLTRLLYCNVVICNTGHYGGSLAFSPFEEANERIIYKYQGQRTFNTHLASLPVRELDRAQIYDFAEGNKKDDGIHFKASPPGYYDKIRIIREEITANKFPF